MRKRDILPFYFLYVILFNLMIPTTSLISENNFEKHPYYTYTDYSKLTYTASFYCWNSTKQTVNGQYFGCYLVFRSKLPVIRGFLIKVDAESDILLKKEHPGNYIGFILNSNSSGTHTIDGEALVYEVWWAGIIVPSKLKFEIELNCKDAESTDNKQERECSVKTCKALSIS